MAVSSKSPLSTCTGVARPVAWEDGCCVLIDQRELPHVLTRVSLHTIDEVITAIKDMTVRGAPAIGAAGAFGIVLAVNTRVAAGSATVPELKAVVEAAKAALDAARPTAVNLMWATERMRACAEALQDVASLTAARFADRMLEAAQELAEEDVRINRALASAGADLIPPKANILHHCNTGALACVDVGTALGVVYECAARGLEPHVWVDETRPRLQGAKLTAWELQRAGVPLHLIADSAAGHLMATGRVDVVLFGADRVAANGDVANKIGTYKLCVVARETGVPAYACVPTSTIDLRTASGSAIPIEERDAAEVTHIAGVRIAPEGVPVYNPAFDVTPARYLTGIITEEGVCYPPFATSLARAKARAEARIAAANAAAIARMKAE